MITETLDENTGITEVEIKHDASGMRLGLSSFSNLDGMLFIGLEASLDRAHIGPPRVQMFLTAGEEAAVLKFLEARRKARE